VACPTPPFSIVTPTTLRSPQKCATVGKPLISQPPPLAMPLASRPRSRDVHRARRPITRRAQRTKLNPNSHRNVVSCLFARCAAARAFSKIAIGPPGRATIAGLDAPIGVRKFREKFLNLARCPIHLRSFGIKSLLHFFCSLEEGPGFLWDRDDNSSTRIAGSPRGTQLSRKRAETPQLHSISVRQGYNDLV
jgi:hypothetical protein